MPEEMLLYTFAVSHFSEKIRWTLDAARLHYEEERLTPFFHVLTTRRLTRGRSSSVPILRAGNDVIADSTHILHWLERNYRAQIVDTGLVPADRELHREVMEIEDRFDRVGAHVIRYVYGFALDYRDEVLELWGADATLPQRAFLRLAFPALRTAFRQGFHVNKANCARSRKAVAEALDWIEERVVRGREFLVGDRLTVADITACALLAPLAAPQEHPLYRIPRYREAVHAHLGDWAQRPALEWVRQRYAKSRRAERRKSRVAEVATK